MKAVGRHTEPSRYPRVICEGESREAHGSNNKRAQIPVRIHLESATPQCVQPPLSSVTGRGSAKSRGSQTIIKIMH